MSSSVVVEFIIDLQYVGSMMGGVPRRNDRCGSSDWYHLSLDMIGMMSINDSGMVLLGWVDRQGHTNFKRVE